jgi:putative DNA-invertase from lambdoid prophage Rac
MTMQVLNAVAEFERDLLIERTNAGIERAKAEGVQMGRPSALTDVQQAEVLVKLAQGVSVSELARTHKTSRTTIQRIRDKA